MRVGHVFIGVTVRESLLSKKLNVMNQVASLSVLGVGNTVNTLHYCSTSTVTTTKFSQTLHSVNHTPSVPK